ncbi:tail tubular protein A [Rhizobium sp. NXC14]|uniref:phage tail protein n=1 Tax=Rhizobium sp. NXC14 TaxID=1981173 RepID=UPI000A203DB2|nr:phage tail protein [Rhizobium sp. NXC14]ARO29949.1 tail tubular protein A [Rhizobium sp. NXC14]
MPVLVPTPTTELEAINLMLSVIGESPVNTAEDTGVVDAVIARQILFQSSRDVQLVGWHWNTEIDYPIAASFPEGELQLPPNTLKVDTTGADEGVDLVQRGNRLYDRKNHTFTVGRTVYVEIVLFLPFDQLPEAARSYIVMRAARQFQERMVGSETIWQFNSRDELKSWSNLLSAEAETLDLNVFRDNPSVQRVTNRLPPGDLV